MAGNSFEDRIRSSHVLNPISGEPLDWSKRVINDDHSSLFSLVSICDGVNVDDIQTEYDAETQALSLIYYLNDVVQKTKEITYTSLVDFRIRNVPGYLLKEDGDYILTEDGGRIEL